MYIEVYIYVMLIHIYVIYVCLYIYYMYSEIVLTVKMPQSRFLE